MAEQLVQMAMIMMATDIYPRTPPIPKTRIVSGRPKKPTPSKGSSIFPSILLENPISAYVTGLMNVFISEPIIAKPMIEESGMGQPGKKALKIGIPDIPTPRRIIP